MGNYFEFKWEKGYAYAPGWHGLTVVPGAVVLMYDDDKQVGVGFTLSTLPSGVKSLTEEKAVAKIPPNDKIELAHDTFEGVWTIDGPNRIADKWAEVGIPIEQIPDEDAKHKEAMSLSSNATVDIGKRKAVNYQTAFCPICHQVVGQVNTLDDGSNQICSGGKVKLQGVKCNNLVLTCKNGHKVRISKNMK
jgi:hypothetical protein